MQPYTPHGDSNSLSSSSQISAPRCNLIPLTGTVTSCETVAKSGKFGCNLIPLTGTVTCPSGSSFFHAIRMQPYTPHGDSNWINRPMIADRADATLFLLRFADFCGTPTGACKNRSAAPAVASLFRPLDALAAAAPHGDSNKTDPISKSSSPLLGDATLYPSRGQ